MGNARQIPAWLTRRSYWLAALLPLLMPLAWSLRELPGMAAGFAWFSLAVLYVVLPLLDALIGRDSRNPGLQASPQGEVVAVPLVAVASYLAVLAWALHAWTTHPAQFSALATLGWTLSLASIGSVVAINVAHELIHRADRRLRALGGILLSCVWYPGFKLEHPRWHHLHVATPADPSSAPRGSTVYVQVPRALWKNTIRGWRLGVEAARKKGRSLPWVRHEMTLWFGLSVALTVGVGLWLGWAAAVLFVAHGLGAAALLEVINYVEHYGLRRELCADGRFERPRVWHSWESDHWLSNAILLQLPRHADHHVNPNRPYTALQKADGAPQLPMGYSGLVLVAFIPPLWRTLIHPRLPA